MAMRLLPGDPARWRRLLALAAAALVALVVGMTAGAEDGGAPRDPGPAVGGPAPTPRTPLREAVGELLVMSFDGTSAPAYIRRRLRAGEGAGVILFGGNVVDAAQLRRLTRSLQRAARGGALIATDQEGGEIRNVPFAGPAAAQSSLTSPESAGAAASQAALGLRRVGVNVNLAPVADVMPSSGGDALGDRLYTGPPSRVAALTTAALRAHARAELEAADLEPFRAAIAADAPLIMAGHALYTRFDPENIASQSRVLLTDVLRDQLGFRGVTITDSIEAQAVLDRSDVATAAVRSIAAGADIVLMTGSGSWNLVYPRLLGRARRDRVRDSARRVLALERRLGLRDEP